MGLRGVAGTPAWQVKLSPGVEIGFTASGLHPDANSSDRGCLSKELFGLPVGMLTPCFAVDQVVNANRLSQETPSAVL